MWGGVVAHGVVVAHERMPRAQVGLPEGRAVAAAGPRRVRAQQRARDHPLGVRGPAAGAARAHLRMQGNRPPLWSSLRS